MTYPIDQLLACCTDFFREVRPIFLSFDSVGGYHVFVSLRDEEGNFIAARAHGFIGLPDVKLVDALSVSAARSWFANRRVQKVMLETDWLEVVKDVLSPNICFSL